MQENKPLLITRRNNMDLVRYYLALSVLIAHFNYLTGFEIPWPTNSFTGVGGFFAVRRRVLDIHIINGTWLPRQNAVAIALILYLS